MLHTVTIAISHIIHKTNNFHNYFIKTVINKINGKSSHHKIINPYYLYPRHVIQLGHEMIVRSEGDI